jgi:hypothetical protein
MEPRLALKKEMTRTKQNSLMSGSLVYGRSSVTAVNLTQKQGQKDGYRGSNVRQNWSKKRLDGAGMGTRGTRSSDFQDDKHLPDIYRALASTVVAGKEYNDTDMRSTYL